MEYKVLSPEYIEMRRRTYKLPEDSIADQKDIEISNREVARQRQMTSKQLREWEKEHFKLQQELRGW